MMKKLFLVILLFIGLQSNFAQHGGGGYAPCANVALSDLSACLSGFGVTYHLIDDGSGGLLLYAYGNPPPGHINSCLVHYNNDRGACPEAPVIVFQSQIIVGKASR